MWLAPGRGGASGGDMCHFRLLRLLLASTWGRAERLYAVQDDGWPTDSYAGINAGGGSRTAGVGHGWAPHSHQSGDRPRE